MCYFKRVLIAIFTSLIVTGGFGQVTIDTTVKHKYDSAYQQLPFDLRQNIERTEKELIRLSKEIGKEAQDDNSNIAPTIAIVTCYQIDTVNKEQIKLDTRKVHLISLYQIDTQNKKKIKLDTGKEHLEKWQFMFCEGGLKLDTLGIILYPGVAQNSGVIISNLIAGKQIRAEYDEWRKWDTTFRKNISDEKTDQLALPLTTIRFVLSDTDFKIGKTIYGYAELISDGYYKDDENFKTGYINKRLLLAYYFKVRVKKNST